MSFRADAKFRERRGARDDVATRAREAREARKTERVRERAVVVCQSHRRAGVVRRERRMRARERLDDALARLTTTEEEKEEKEENNRHTVPGRALGRRCTLVLALPARGGRPCASRCLRRP